MVASPGGQYLPHLCSDPGADLAAVEAGTRLMAMPATPPPPSAGAPEAVDPAAAERRNAFRHPVEVSRPIALMLLDGQGEPASPWMVADILDVSLGGMCLLAHGRYNHPFASTTSLQLDLTSQPSFGVPELVASLRWYVRTDPVVTLGVAFERPLPALPMLQSRK